MIKTGGYKFYDKVATKFGNYSTEAVYSTKYQTENPEEVFKKLLIKYSGKDKNVLDLGCADGRFTLAIAPNFKKVIAVDLSKKMLKAAKLLQKKEVVRNVSFEEVDAYNTPYQDGNFDVIYSRRGPTPFDEIYRLLKKDGCFINIGIGEKDTQELKEVFGRGQNYGKWSDKTLQRDQKKLKSLSFELIFGKDYSYKEYYPDYKNLDLFLQGVPIFTDYDSKKDRHSLEKYMSTHQTEQGISLPRHRIVVVVQK